MLELECRVVWMSFAKSIGIFLRFVEIHSGAEMDLTGIVMCVRNFYAYGIWQMRYPELLTEALWSFYEWLNPDTDSLGHRLDQYIPSTLLGR